MEHFPIVLALSRAALQTPNTAVENHLRRLIKALEKDGQAEQADGLNKLVRNTGKSVAIQPSRVVLSLAAMGGEMLTPSVKPPVDKETSAPLAEIVFPSETLDANPIFEDNLSASIDSLLEEWRNIDKLKESGINPALALMLFGAPGTGKTFLAHHIARELNYPLVVAKLDGLISSFLGTTARNISNLFAFANRYKCILLLDEFDAVAKLRDDPNELGELKRVVNTLLQCLDNRSNIGFTISITNHEALLDPAIWRRFDIRIEIPKPVHQIREQILLRNLPKNVKLKKSQINFLTWITDGYSGSDIAKLSNFIKRKIAIQGSKFDFFETVRSYIILSAKDQENNRRQAAIGRPEELAIELNRDPEHSMPQEALAELFGKAQSTISRWLKSEKKHKE
ncbi:AAA family ATPase [Pseudomonas aeruginosa]|uniref:AAA family ATPase n=1 Tax=Pseudomonas aeruginosa TaxID=287 RepID=UPI0021F0D79D|nr:ATP-binding protein [Pseudomonas aeruginosa]MCV4111719.1 ATP-binding protein [Pseudomonas aeruginosa]MCV4244651.1 ATP-binding protein [Pseudomonas aeruginosa]MCV4250836.1 ATP-binding protein [Pseudomonas aeruginosa]HCL3477228.1 ATP-binding protein [Pseudomonas aeruginosa]